MLEVVAENVLLILRVDESCSDLSMRANKSHNKSLILRSTELSNAKRREPLLGAPAVDVLPPATRHGGTQGGDLFGGVSAYVGTRW